MARKSAKSRHVEPEEESQEIEDEGVRDEAEDGEPGGGRGGISKVEAVRRALAAGHESPEAGTAFIRRRFGIDVDRQHFSSTKSQIRKKEREDTPAAKASPAPRKRAPASVEGYLAPPPGPLSEGESDLLAAMETMKPLIAALGADKVKRIVDLLG